MTTTQLLIICVTVLAGLVVASHALLERDRQRAQLQREVAMHERAAVAPVAELAAAVESLAAANAAPPADDPTLPGPSLVGRTVVVNTRGRDAQTVRGVLIGHYADRLVLRDAMLLHVGGAQDAGGLVSVPLLNVSTVQEIEPPAEPA